MGGHDVAAVDAPFGHLPSCRLRYPACGDCDLRAGEEATDVCACIRYVQNGCTVRHAEW